MPYRAVGLVCDPIPFSVAQLGVETFVTTAVGRAFHVFAGDKAAPRIHWPAAAAAAAALATSGELTAAACGTAVHVYNRAELVATLQGEHAAPVRHLLMLSETTLLSVCEGGTLIAWSLPEGDVVRRLHAGFTPTSLCHPATYLNKVLLGASDGRLQLHNVRSGQKVHEFAGWGSAVLCLEQSPALDVVGIGHADGRIVLHNLRVDRSVLTLSHEEGDACSSPSERMACPSSSPPAALPARCTSGIWRSARGSPPSPTPIITASSRRILCAASHCSSRWAPRTTH